MYDAASSRAPPALEANTLSLGGIRKPLIHVVDITICVRYVYTVQQVSTNYSSIKVYGIDTLLMHKCVYVESGYISFRTAVRTVFFVSVLQHI